MFYIFFAAIAFALYVIFHDNHEGEGRSRKTSARAVYRPEQQGSVPQTPVSQTSVSPTPKPLEPAPVIKPAVKPVAARPAVSTIPNRAVSERPLSWTYLYSMQYDDSLVEDAMRTEITGMRYYCSFADVGLVNGTVQPEPENAHDPRAQVVIRADGKKLGYIPRYALDEYWNFTGGHLVCPFAGRIVVDSKGYMRADIAVALPANREFVKERLSDFVS